MNDLKDKIQKLKEEKDVVILAHYYVEDEIQELADYVGDSYYLSDIATKLPNQVLVFCGVTFMGESAKVLNPEKTVLIPDESALCPMAEMVKLSYIDTMRQQIENLAVVCYINSTTRVKTKCDVCVTSANALTVVSNLPNKNILFVPDGNLGRYISSQLPHKQFYFNEGYCHVHHAITREDVEAAKEKHPGVKLLVHPECRIEISEMADYVGSTTGIIKAVDDSEETEFLIATEIGVFYEMKKRHPKKRFYPITQRQICGNMKKITLQKVYDCLNQMSGQVEVEGDMIEQAQKPLVRMLELAKKEARV